MTPDITHVRFALVPQSLVRTLARMAQASMPASNATWASQCRLATQARATQARLAGAA